VACEIYSMREAGSDGGGVLDPGRDRDRTRTTGVARSHGGFFITKANLFSQTV
jgi:hypothetical protein